MYEFGGRNANEILEEFLIDDGLASRKRRNTIMDPIYNYIGIGSSYHSQYDTVTVIILAEDAVSLGNSAGIQYPRERRGSTSEGSPSPTWARKLPFT